MNCEIRFDIDDDYDQLHIQWSLLYDFVYPTFLYDVIIYGFHLMLCTDIE